MAGKTEMPVAPNTPLAGRRWRRTAASAVALVLGASVVLAFPFGPLFPWSPWKPGYERLRLARSHVCYPAGTALPSTFRSVDDYIAEAERFHGFNARSRITVILCRDWGGFRRLQPQFGGRAVGAAALATGTVIYVTPRVAERGFDHGEFLRHEISHAVLHQNQTLWAAFRTSRAESFFEGLAVSFGRQKAFVTTGEALDYIRSHEVTPLFEPASRQGEPRNMRLNYQVWRLFVEYLRETGGPVRFQALLRLAMEDPGRYPEHMNRVHGMPLPVALRQFQEAVRSGRWQPAC